MLFVGLIVLPRVVAVRPGRETTLRDGGIEEGRAEGKAEGDGMMV